MITTPYGKVMVGYSQFVDVFHCYRPIRLDPASLPNHQYVNLDFLHHRWPLETRCGKPLTYCLEGYQR